MAEFNAQEWAELKAAGRVELNGVVLDLHVGKRVRPEDLPLPYCPGYFIGEHEEWRNIFTAAGYKTFDFAMPQQWYDAYIAQHGRTPRGVWWYPPRDHPTHGNSWLHGCFVDRVDALDKLGQLVFEAKGLVAA